MMTEYQKHILAEIQHLKAQKPRDDKQLRRLARRLTADDDIYTDMKRESKYQEGRKGSRSPHFGKWARD
jgi:hypothetical protein